MLGSEFHRTGQSDVLGPVIDIDRTWHTGRENENFGEDPFLTGAMVAPEVRAIQATGVQTTSSTAAPTPRSRAARARR